MRIKLLIASLLIATPLTTYAIADTPPSDDLINTYLSTSKAQEISTAQIDGMMDYFKNKLSLPQDQLQTMKSYLDKTVGWDAVKPQEISLIKKNYSSIALQSMIDYSNSPIGIIYNNQSIAFNRDYAAMITESTSQPQNQKIETTPITHSEILKSNSPLITKEVVERTLNGKTYFTGTVINSSKKTLQNAQVEINLFQGDKFVDQYSTYITGAIMPNVPRYYKVACGCDGTPATHDRIKTLVNSQTY